MPYVRKLEVKRSGESKVISYGGGIIRFFDKTPSDIVCPHFWQLNWAYGCRFECAYCYLQGTFHGNKKPWYRPLNQILETLDQFFQENKNEAFVLNSGELTDSLVYPNLIKEISDKFEEQNKHRLLLLTKSNSVKLFLEEKREQSIFSFSINASNISKRWEKRTPMPKKRIEAAKLLSDIGNEIRFRIDPIFPVENWKNIYEGLINIVFSSFEVNPERITLGTPRGLAKTFMFSKDRSWKEYFTNCPDETGWGKKLPVPIRREIYTFILGKLAEYGYSKSNISFCKETVQLWEDLGLYHRKCKCNCI